jgi:hypothetical protein
VGFNQRKLIMAGSVNKVIIVGNLGTDPEVRDLPSGQKVANLRVGQFNLGPEVWSDSRTKDQTQRILPIRIKIQTYRSKRERTFTFGVDTKNRTSEAADIHVCESHLCTAGTGHKYSEKRQKLVGAHFRIRYLVQYVPVLIVIRERMS